MIEIPGEDAIWMDRSVMHNFSPGSAAKETRARSRFMGSHVALCVAYALFIIFWPFIEIFRMR